MNVVERGKLIAFCKVFQHHSSLFPIISLLSYNIQHHSTTFHIIQHHSPSFPIILQHSSLFSIILHHYPSYPIFRQHISYFDTIHHNPTTSLIFRQHSPSFDKTTIFFYNIFRHHFFSTSFDNNFVNLIFRQKIFVICCQIKNLSFAVLSLWYYHFVIINLILSICYYHYLIINLILSF